MGFYHKLIFITLSNLSLDYCASSVVASPVTPTVESAISAISRLLDTNFWRGNVNIWMDLGDGDDALNPILTGKTIRTHHSTVGSFNFGLFNGSKFSSFLKCLNASQFLLHPSVDKTLFYQWTNQEPRLLYHHALGRFKFKAELVQHTQDGLVFNSFCFFCDSGNGQLIRHQFESSLTLGQLFRDSTTNFYGKKLRYSTSKRNPILVNFRQVGGIWEYYGGVSTPILDAFKRFLNCSISTHPDEEYGNELPNGSFSGVIGKIAAGEYDIGVLAQHTNRFRVAYFSHLIVTGNVVLSTRVPVKSSSFNAFNLDAFLLLFGVCFGGVLPFYMVLTKVTSWAEAAPPFKTILDRGISFIYIPLYEQELPKSDVPKSTSLKILFAFWLYFTLIISTAYKSKLLDLMIQGSPEYLPTTFDELAELPEFEVVARGYGGALTATLRAIQTATFSNIVGRMRTTDVTAECIGNAIRKPKAVCICYREVLELVSCRNYTDKGGKKMLQISPESKSAFYLHGCVATRKDAVYKETIDRVVHLVYAAYLPQYSIVQDFRQAESEGRLWARERDDSEYENLGHDDGTRKPLKIKHFRQIFTLLFVCLAISTGFFGMELIRQLWNRKQL